MAPVACRKTRLLAPSSDSGPPAWDTVKSCGLSPAVCGHVLRQRRERTQQESLSKVSASEEVFPGTPDKANLPPRTNGTWNGRTRFPGELACNDPKPGLRPYTF